MRYDSADTIVREKGGEEVLQCLSRGSPAACGGLCWNSLWRITALLKDSDESVDISSMGDTLEQGKSMRSPPPEEEGVAVITCDELAATLISHPCATSG